MAQKISALPVKAKVRDTKTKYKGATIGWVIGDKNHAGYPASSVTLVAECMLTLKCFDAIESGGGNSRNSYGNNRYIYANIRQWLNKAGTGWYAKQHTYDQPPPTPMSGVTTMSTTPRLDLRPASGLRCWPPSCPLP